MVGITLSKLRREGCVAKVIVHSCEGDLYLLDVITNEQRYRVVDEAKEPFVAHSLWQMHRALDGIAAQESVMIQHSAYDEMIGTPAQREEDQGISLGW